MEDFEEILRSIILLADGQRRRATMFWNVASFLERKGYLAGIVIVSIPILYDILGIIYGRDMRISIEIRGVVTQVIGLLIIGLAKYARRWGRK